MRILIPWCFSYDKVNYSRYLTPYFAHMTNLGDKNPEVQKAFKEGSSSVQLANNRFCAIEKVAFCCQDTRSFQVSRSNSKTALRMCESIFAYIMALHTLTVLKS